MRKNRNILEKWHKCDKEFVAELCVATNSPGKLFKGDIAHLPSGLGTMKGLTDYYYSGYLVNYTASADLTAAGEFIAIREDDLENKGYNYVFAKDTDGNYYYSGPYKYFNAHHFKKESETPIDKILGNIESMYNSGVIPRIPLGRNN